MGDLSSPDGINDSPALCALVDGCDAEAQANAKAALTPIAEAAKAKGEDMLFFVATSSDGADDPPRHPRRGWLLRRARRPGDRRRRERLPREVQGGLARAQAARLSASEQSDCLC